MTIVHNFSTSITLRWGRWDDMGLPRAGTGTGTVYIALAAPTSVACRIEQAVADIKGCTQSIDRNTTRWPKGLRALTTFIFLPHPPPAYQPSNSSALPSDRKHAIRIFVLVQNDALGMHVAACTLPARGLKWALGMAKVE